VLYHTNYTVPSFLLVTDLHLLLVKLKEECQERFYHPQMNETP